MSQRKLQQEMDKVFKKIAEGLEVFDTLYERHSNCGTSSQKDKLESDLKKEIKKLQRFREQVKTWQATNEVKDKEKLNENRRLVEIAMEKYKVVEKGSKTKAFSDQSLANLDEPKVDNEATEFIRTCLEEILRQEESLEAEIERLNSGKKGRKVNSYASEERRAEIEETLETHLWHTEKLELILRLLENDILQSDDVMNIQEDIKYYLEDNQNPDFINDETIYDELNLDTEDSFVGEVQATLGNSHTKDDDIISATPSNQDTPVKQKKKEPSPAPVLAPAPTPGSTTTTTTTATTTSTAVTSKQLPTTNTTNGHTTDYSSNSSSHSTPTNTTPLPFAIGASSSTAYPTMTTLKPAPVPVKPAGELKWSAAVAANSNANSTTTSAGTASQTISIPSPGIISQPQRQVSQPIPQQKSEGPYAWRSEDKSKINGSNSASMNSNAFNAASVLEALKKQKPQETVNSTSTKSDTADTASNTNNNTPEPVTFPSASSQLPVTPQPKVLSKGEIGAENDPNFRFLPPGIQSSILSFVIARNRSENEKTPSLSNIGAMLSVPRNFSPLPDGTYPPGLEAQRISTIWNSVRTSTNLEVDAQNVDSATLFYAHYFALSQKERDVATAILTARQWRVNAEKTMWFQRHSPIKVSGDGFEISDFNIFDAKKWGLTEKRNYKIDYSQFAPSN